MQPRHRTFLLFFALAALVVAAAFWFRRTTPAPTPVLTSRRLDWGHTTRSSGCQMSGPQPDTACTPGDILPELSGTHRGQDLLAFFSYVRCARHSHIAAREAKGNGMYGVPHPANNRGASQVCEIDHPGFIGPGRCRHPWPNSGHNARWVTRDGRRPAFATRSALRTTCTGRSARVNFH